MSERAEQIEWDYSKPTKQLHADLQLAWERCGSETKDGFWKRTAFFIAFAFVESFLDDIQSEILDTTQNIDASNKLSDDLQFKTLSPGQLQLLEGHRFRVKDNGHVVKTDVRLGIKRNILFTVQACVDLASPESADVDRSESDGYDALCRSIKVRNDLTHPSRGRGVEVSDRQLQDLIDGVAWITDTISRLLSARLQYIADVWDQEVTVVESNVASMQERFGNLARRVRRQKSDENDLE